MRVSVAGADPESAPTVVVMLHGGGSGADDFLSLAPHLGDDTEICWLAPQALGQRWYPGPSAESRGGKEPYFTIAVESLRGLLERHAQQRLVLLGFDDGAGLVSELLSQRPTGLTAAWIASGGMVGEPSEWPTVATRLDDVSILVSASRDDAQIAAQRPRDTAELLRAAGAQVRLHLYDGATHHIAADEIEQARELIREASG